jgi:hypothetical protein
MAEENSCTSTTGNCWMCERGRIFDAKKFHRGSIDKDYALVELDASGGPGNPVELYG